MLRFRGWQNVTVDDNQGVCQWGAKAVRTRDEDRVSSRPRADADFTGVPGGC